MFLIDHWQPLGFEAGSMQGLPEFHGVRVKDLTYVEYVTGEREFYDLGNDPNQLANAASSADDQLIARLSNLLAGLRSCAGTTCRQIEDAGY